MSEAKTSTAAETVFISYRRGEATTPVALLLKSALEAHGYDVFVDVSDSTAGSWREHLRAQVCRRAHFLLLLTDNALSRTSADDDCMRWEIELAREAGRNIVPLCWDKVDVASAKRDCPDDLCWLFDYQAAHVHCDSSSTGDIEELRRRFLAPRNAPASNRTMLSFSFLPRKRHIAVLLVALVLASVLTAGAAIAYFERLDTPLTDEHRIGLAVLSLVACSLVLAAGRGIWWILARRAQVVAECRVATDKPKA